MNFLKNIQDWKKFPNIETLGYFSPLGNYIYLDEYLDEKDFQKSAENPYLDWKRFSVFVHEYQHYLDHVSTLWGVKNIYKIYKAFDAAIMSNEHIFFRLRELNLELKRNYFLDYYTETYNDIVGDYENRWEFQITSGLRFDYNGNVNEDFPIPFISFETKEKVKIRRVPLSIVSLLETTATFAEYEFQINAISKFKSSEKEEQILELNKRLESKLYNSKFALYSAAVHLLTATLNIDNPIEGYKISSVFAKIALNLPTSLFLSIKIPIEFESEDEGSIRSKKMLKNLDRGFAFYLLIRNYYEKFGVYNSARFDVENILSASNLPEEKEIEKLISEEILKLDFDTMLERNNFNRMIIDKTFFGSKFRRQTGIGQQKAIPDFTELIRDKIHIIFNSTYFEYEDLDLKPIIDKSIKQMDLTREEWFRLYTFCEKRMDGFNEICGI